jgi:hypothetical protein
MSYVTLIMSDGTPVLVEVEAPERKNIRLSERGVIQDLNEQFAKVMDLAKLTAISANDGYRSIPEAARPKEFEFSFGMKLNAEAGVVFAKMGSEGSFQVTLRWK